MDSRHAELIGKYSAIADVQVFVLVKRLWIRLLTFASATNVRFTASRWVLATHSWWFGT